MQKMQGVTTPAAPSQTGPSPYTHTQAGPIADAPCQPDPTPTRDKCDGTGFLNRTSILKITQIGFSILTVICTMVDYWYRAARFINFVGLSSLLVAILYLVIHSVNRLQNLFGECTFLFEMIQYCVWSVFYLTAAIMAMANAYDAIIATAVFATGGTIAFSVDTYFQIQDWRYRRSRMTQQAQPLAMTQMQPLVVSQPKPVTMIQPQPVTMIQPQPVTVIQPQEPVVNIGMNRLPRPRYNIILF